MGLLSLLVRAGLAASGGDARRQVQGGAVRVNDQQASDERASVDGSQIVSGVVKLSVGKKKHVLVRPV